MLHIYDLVGLAMNNQQSAIKLYDFLLVIEVLLDYTPHTPD
jgi:hypothetical protein